MIGKQYSYRMTMVMASFILILFGEGAYKANISAFGAEQLNSKDVDSTRRYFDIYYFYLNIGAMLAVIISAYIQTRQGFFIGYIAPTATIVLAFFIFLFSSHLYTIVPHEQMVGKVFQIFKDARRKRHQNERSLSLPLQQKLSWLDYARIKYGGSYLDWEVDEVQFLVMVIPVLVVLLPFAIIYSQMNATFLNQGLQMKLPFEYSSFPVAWLLFFNIFIILILLPIMNRFVYPWLKRHGYNMAPLTRISIGIVLSCFAVIAAGFVEIFVIQDFTENNTIEVKQTDNNSTKAANLTIFLQVPQYLFVGLGEIFAYIGGLDFAYRNAPRSMQGLVMSSNFVIDSVGSLLGSGLLKLSVLIHLVKRKRKGEPYDLTYYFLY
ncbi:solute carrier family 15 member 4-like isoform X2 [Xenia sp. Carnegie-2017]|nr:solute carrier family 15 member 4-like isoform X2 [Xenia sp. Carnegie-2017]